ncbi:MAG: flagellar basal body P-ring formation protein FlgA [Pirellulaceae bacterium]|nr:flagellar basal body P-ring formation protein FlgA [Pirellulaceae bacterium]
MQTAISTLTIRNRSAAIACLMLILCALASPQSCTATDQILMRFYTDPTIAGDIVRLKDLVEIVAGSSESLDKLKEMPLGPAPRPGTMQTWQRSDVVQHLELRGVHPKSIRWTGKDSTSLQGIEAAGAVDANSLTPAFVDQRIAQTARTNVTTAIKEYLNLRSHNRTDWRVELELPGQYLKTLQSRGNLISVSGGQAPWTGPQDLVLQIKQHGKVLSLPIQAIVELPPQVVVASGPLRRDQFLTEEMLSYAPLPTNIQDQKCFTDIQQLVGKQLRRSVSTNQPLTEELVGDPIVVQRNELVEVESISGAVVVRTSAKSLGAGSVGQLIDIELHNRKRLMATVMGPSKVRIAAVAQTAADR